MRKTKILICSSELGAGKRGASLGPDAIRISAVNHFYNIFELLPSDEIRIKKFNKFSPEHKSAKYIKIIAQTHEKICAKMAATIREGYHPLIFSGDHSNAAGFISGFREALPDKKIGIIWIDAHGDIHSPYSSPSGNVHGMPVAILLGVDTYSENAKPVKKDVSKHWNQIKATGLARITPKITPQDIQYIAIRDLEEEEWAKVHELGIKYYAPDLIKEKSIDHVIEEVKNHFVSYDALYVSFDVDSLDPSISMGTGTPVPNGLTMDQAKKLIKAFTRMPNFLALEITEVNPLLDCENKMANAVVKILRDSFAFYDEPSKA